MLAMRALSIAQKQGVGQCEAPPLPVRQSVFAGLARRLRPLSQFRRRGCPLG